jgi:predicted nuclease of predicted toxin-antitoxin system
MKFLIDENLPPRLAAWLNVRGHDAVHVCESSKSAPDREVAERAVLESRVIITKDNDFDPPRFGERVVHLRIGNCSTPDLLEWLDARLNDVLERLTRGEAYLDVD